MCFLLQTNQLFIDIPMEDLKIPKYVSGTSESVSGVNVFLEIT